MKVRMLDVLGCQQALETVGRMKLPPRLAFTFARLKTACRAILADYEAVRMGLVDEHYGPQDEQGMRKIKSMRDLTEFNEELRALTGSEVEAPGIGKILLSSLAAILPPENGERVEGKDYLSVDDLAGLAWLIEEVDHVAGDGHD
jgi:hypothetical protein